MSKKSYLLSLMTTMMVAMLSVGFVSCGDDDDIVSPDNGQPINPSTPVSDPEGTIVVNMNNGSKDNWIDIGIGSKIHIDDANNFVGDYSSVEFASVGLISGLGNITTIPTTGWAKTSAVVPGTGYVVKYGSTYARLYVVEYTVNTSGGIMGATVKYQSPFQLPISLESTSLTFTSDASFQSVKLKNPTSVSIERKPVWCSVSTESNSITVSVTENLSAQQYSGDIILKNSVSSVKLSVTQKGSASPKFDGGRGTTEDPYQIKTVQQLKNIRKYLNANFILTADITLNEEASGNGWDPIGKPETPFTGTLNGQGYKIKNVWMKRPTTDRVGLFGHINNATIMGVRLEIGSNGITGQSDVGGICGYAEGNSLIKKCSVIGSIAGSANVGGICGEARSYYYSYSSPPSSSPSFEECYSEGSLGSIASAGVQSIGVGGITGNCSAEKGWGTHSLISNCYSTSSLSGKDCYGISYNGTHSKCYYAGIVSCSRSFSCDGAYTYFDSTISGPAGHNNARTTEQMKTQSNYEGWDFDNIWKITEGQTYPTLRCFDK